MNDVRMFSGNRKLTLIWLVLVVAGTLAPLDFRSPPQPAFQYGPYQQQAADFALNVLLMMPLGALLQREGGHRPFFMILGWIALATCVLSAAIEYCQAFLPQRDSSLIDVAANTAGACLGVALDRRWGGWLAGRFDRMRSRTPRVAVARDLVFRRQQPPAPS
jgi:VanZ family protein